MMTGLDRGFLLASSVLAAYQVASGVEGLSPFVLGAYTAAFGVLLVADLLLIILGFEILESPVVAVVASIIPLGLSAGLVAQYHPEYTAAVFGLSIAGLLVVILTRVFGNRRAAALTLAVVHAAAGLTIFSLPLLLSFNGRTPPGFALVGIGGFLIGVGGLLLAFLKAGHPVLSRGAILAVFPGLLLLTTAAFVAGFWLA